MKANLTSAYFMFKRHPLHHLNSTVHMINDTSHWFKNDRYNEISFKKVIYLYLPSHLQAAATENEDNISLPQDAMFTTLLSHIETIGWSKVSQVSTDFSMIYLETK